MKAFLLLMLAAALGAPASAAPIHEIASDPLMQKILGQQLTQPNGGITAAVAVRGARKGIELELIDPLAPLQPVEGLAEAAPAKARKARRPARRADEQLERIDADGQKASWDKTGK